LVVRDIGATKAFARKYDSLRVHAKRHYDLAGITAHWRAQMHKELRNALGG